MCTLCEKKTTRSFVVSHIDLNIIRNFRVQCSKDALQSPSQINEKCCPNKTNIVVQYGPHLLVIVETRMSNRMRICDIPCSINIESTQNYDLVGFVAFQGKYDGSPGHYVGYVLVGTSWVLHDDTSSRKNPCVLNPKSEIDPQLIFYIKKY